MRSFTPFLLSLLSTAPAVTARSIPTDSSVVSLTEDTFSDFIQDHPLVLANFYAPWCRWSKRLAPEFEAAAKELEWEDIPLVKIDCTREEDLCNEHGIRAYPTLRVFRWGEETEYEGQRGSESIVSYMTEDSDFYVQPYY